MGRRSGDTGLYYGRGTGISRQFATLAAQLEILVCRVYRINHAVSVHNRIGCLRVYLFRLLNILLFYRIAHRVLIQHIGVCMIAIDIWF